MPQLSLYHSSNPRKKTQERTHGLRRGNPFWWVSARAKQRSQVTTSHPAPAFDVTMCEQTGTPINLSYAFVKAAHQHSCAGGVLLMIIRSEVTTSSATP